MGGRCGEGAEVSWSDSPAVPRAAASYTSVTFVLPTKEKDLLGRTVSFPSHKCEVQDTDVYDKEMICTDELFYRDWETPSL